MSTLNQFAIILIILVSSSRAQDRPILRPNPAFDVKADVDQLYKAMAGIGTNETAITNVLCNRVYSERGNITATYNATHGKTLADALKDDLGGQLEDLTVQLTEDALTFYCIEMENNMGALLTSTDVNSIFEMLMGRNKTQMDAIKTAYSQRFGYTLDKRIEEKTSGNTRNYLLSLQQGLRDQNTDPNNVDMDLVRLDARNLYDGGELIPGTENAVFIRIFSERSLPHLRALMTQYNASYGHSLQDAVYGETSGDFRNVLLDTLAYATNRYDYYARVLKNAFDGKVDRVLRRILVSRAEIDLANIKDEFRVIYGKTVESEITGILSGAYRDAMLDLVS